MASPLLSPLVSPLMLLAADSSLTGPVPLAGGKVVACSVRCPGAARVNEDAVAVVPVGPQAGVLLVADGVGGGRAGEVAARIALETVVAALAGVETSESALRGAVLDGIERANEAVLELGLGAGTTLAAVALAGDRARPLHVGDSDILLFGQRGRLHHQSVAHGPTGFAVEAGVLEPEDAVHHDERHLVSNLVGSREMRIEIGPALAPAVRDTLLLASDGVTDNVYVSELVDLLRLGSLPAAAAALAALVRERMAGGGGADLPCKPDDFSFLIYRRDTQAPLKSRQKSV